ncbi:MAG TPA: DUF3558 domain-containing protein [Pseudonocardiaceae bacterium]|nr:DUF3558 domain-containing protein [Pseudonocardiaceae bacterium]
MLAAVLFGLVACSSGTVGTATPTQGDGSLATGGGGSSTSSSSSPGSGNSLASIQPCDLATPSVLSQLQLTKLGTSTDSGARSCRYQKPVDVNGVNGYTAGVDVRDSQGLKDVNTDGSTVTDDQIGSHQGKQLKSSIPGDCLVAIGVSDSSRVDVSVNAGTDTNQACDVANQLAKAVEPQLPPGN